MKKFILYQSGMKSQPTFAQFWVLTQKTAFTMAKVRQLLFILTSIWFFCFESNLDQTWWDCSIHWIVTIIIKITDQNKETKKFLSIFFAIIWVVKRRFLAIVLPDNVDPPPLKTEMSSFQNEHVYLPGHPSQLPIGLGNFDTEFIFGKFLLWELRSRNLFYTVLIYISTWATFYGQR